MFLQLFWDVFKMLKFFSIIFHWDFAIITKYYRDFQRLNNTKYFFNPRQDASQRMLMNISSFVFFIVSLSYCKLFPASYSTIQHTESHAKVRGIEREVHIIQMRIKIVGKCVQCDIFSWESTSHLAPKASRIWNRNRNCHSQVKFFDFYGNNFLQVKCDVTNKNIRRTKNLNKRKWHSFRVHVHTFAA